MDTESNTKKKIAVTKMPQNFVFLIPCYLILLGCGNKQA